MGTKLVTNLVAEVSAYLDDTTNVNWDRDDLLTWLNYAEAAICLIKPDAYSEVFNDQLNPGTEQMIPSTAVMLGRLLRNMGADGTTPGIPITEIPIKVMDRKTDFHTATAETAVKHFIRIPGSNDKYYVWPPVHASTAVYVDMVCPATPTEITVADWSTTTATINLPDIYVNALFNLMVFKACDMLSSDMPGMTQKATAALAQAIQMITGKNDAEAMTRARSAMDIPKVMQGGPVN